MEKVLTLIHPGPTAKITKGSNLLFDLKRTSILVHNVDFLTFDFLLVIHILIKAGLKRINL